MSTRSFRSVFMVASCAGAALGCYLVSLRVASERAALENVETRIVLAQRDIRLLQTEIGTRGRLAQLERWNVKVLALSAPAADQFLDGGFALAKLVAPERQVDLQAPVVLAAAPAHGPRPRVEGLQPSARHNAADGASARDMLHTASLKREPRISAGQPAEPRTPAPTATKPAATKPTAAKVAAAKSPSAARAKPPKLGQADPLAGADPLAPRAATTAYRATAKDSGPAQ